MTTMMAALVKMMMPLILVANLSHPEHSVRSRAQAKLERVGTDVEVLPLLAFFQQNHEELEVRIRCDELIAYRISRRPISFFVHEPYKRFLSYKLKQLYHKIENTRDLTWRFRDGIFHHIKRADQLQAKSFLYKLLELPLSDSELGWCFEQFLLMGETAPIIGYLKDNDECEGAIDKLMEAKSYEALTGLFFIYAKQVYPRRATFKWTQRWWWRMGRSTVHEYEIAMRSFTAAKLKRLEEEVLLVGDLDMIFAFEFFKRTSKEKPNGE